MRATLAIVRRRLDRAYALDWFTRFLLGFAVAAIVAPLLSRTAALLISTVLLPLTAASEAGAAATLRRTSFFAMPLFGRQLARALAVAPALTALATPFGFLCGFALRHTPLGGELWLVTLCANVVGALVALGAVFRDGALAWLYYALTAGSGAAVVAPFIVPLQAPLAVSLALAALLGFVALRAFGETLARYDPLPQT